MQHALEEVLGREHAACASSMRSTTSPPSASKHQRQFGARVGVGDRAAHGAAVADLEMRDVRERQRQQRHFLAPASARHSTLACVAAAPTASMPPSRRARSPGRRCARCRSAAGLRQPHVQHRHQRLAAGQDARVVAVLRRAARPLRRRCRRARNRRPPASLRHPQRAAAGAATSAPQARRACRRPARPSCSNSCRSTILAAPSSMRPPTAATLPRDLGLVVVAAGACRRPGRLERHQAGALGRRPADRPEPARRRLLRRVEVAQSAISAA